MLEAEGVLYRHALLFGIQMWLQLMNVSCTSPLHSPGTTESVFLILSPFLLGVSADLLGSSSVSIF